MFGSKQDPYHTRPGEEAAYPQDEADQAHQKRKRKWLGVLAEVAADIFEGILEFVFDSIG